VIVKLQHETAANSNAAYFGIDLRCHRRPIPSRRHPRLVYDFASRLADALGLPFVEALKRTREAPEQKTMANSSMQARNVRDTLDAIDCVPSGVVLLLDDIVDSGWTLTLAGWLLRRRGSGVVHPFTLARATARNI